jgi:hypothetical protein
MAKNKRVPGTPMITTQKQVMQSYGDWIIDYLNCPHREVLLTHLLRKMSQCPHGTMEQVEKWTQEYLDLEWQPYFLALMFHHISGSVQEKLRQMHKEISRFYGKLASWVVRDPKLPKLAHLLPRGVFLPDGLCYKREKLGLTEAKINDGLHFHGIILVPTRSRLKVPFLQHLREKSKIYARGNIARIHAEPIWDHHQFVADYAGKAVKRGRVSCDDVLILPRTGKELQRDTAESRSGPDRAIKDIMSAHNVSLETAQDLCRKRLQRTIRSSRK